MKLRGDQAAELCRATGARLFLRLIFILLSGYAVQWRSSGGGKALVTDSGGASGNCSSPPPSTPLSGGPPDALAGPGSG